MIRSVAIIGAGISGLTAGCALKKYGFNLVNKDEIVVLTKIDLIQNKELKDKIRDLEKVSGKRVLKISSADRVGLTELSKEIYSYVSKNKKHK